MDTSPPGRWSTRGTRFLDSLLRTLDGSTATVHALAASGQLLAAGYDDGSIAVWDLGSSGRRNTTPATAAPITSLVFDPEGERLIVGRLGTVEILEVDSLQSLASVAAPELDMQSAAFTADGTLVAAGARVAIAAFETSAATDQFSRRALAQRLERRFNLLRRAQADLDPPAEAEMTGLDANERRELLAYVRTLGTNPNFLNSEALSVVRRSDATRAEYELALRRIHAALPFRPDDLSFLKTLAFAQLRLGDHRAALATVERAEALLLQHGQAPRAADLAVRVIAEQALGQHARAQESLARLRLVMRAPDEASEIESQGFLVEAERAVSGLASTQR